MTAGPMVPTLDDIRAAHERIRPYVHRTPVMSSTLLDRECGATLYFKCEHLQNVGAFKARGACNAVFSLTEEEMRRGVVTHSSGNHGAALARAAALRGITAHIVMPRNAPRVKQRAVAGYGATIILCDPTPEAREHTCAEVQRRTGATLVHPYDDDRIIAGAATAAVELLEEVPDLDVVLAPVGGGGLLSGTALAVKALRGSTLVLGAEPAGADDAVRSLRAGRIVDVTADTVADGLRTGLSERTFGILQRHVDDILTVSEAGIIAAYRRLWEILKQVVEPSGGVAYGAVREDVARFAGRRVGIILTGGNVDLDSISFKAP
ncbi:MAG: putative serine/threonine dehydratase [Gemmatimonadetes bacterium]|jgi:threonine dehydratase|nr:putative serine/threonine dehydratase [Gemmatimonadota bacterium]